MRTINVGLLGCGTVGSGVVKLFQEHPDLLDRRVGAKLRIRKVAVRSAPRVPVDAKLHPKDAMEVVRDPQIDIIVELIGGTGVAKTLCLEAVANGKALAINAPDGSPVPRNATTLLSMQFELVSAQATWATIGVESIRLYLDGESSQVSALREALCGRVVATLAQRR